MESDECVCHSLNMIHVPEGQANHCGTKRSLRLACLLLSCKLRCDADQPLRGAEYEENPGKGPV